MERIWRLRTVSPSLELFRMDHTRVALEMIFGILWIWSLVECRGQVDGEGKLFSTVTVAAV